MGVKYTKRKLTMEVIREVYERDEKTCVCCRELGKTLDPPHHAFYGGEANRKENRNDADQLVTICHHCHFRIHHGKGSQELRQQCKDYLKSYYEDKD